MVVTLSENDTCFGNDLGEPIIVPPHETVDLFRQDDNAERRLEIGVVDISDGKLIDDEFACFWSLPEFLDTFGLFSDFSPVTPTGFSE